MKCKVKSANVDFVRKSKEGRSNNTFRVGVISKATHETMKIWSEREKEGNSKRWKVISKNVKMCPMPKPLSNKFKLLPVTVFSLPTHEQQYALRMKHRRRVTRYSSYGIAFAFFTSINSSFKLLVNEHKNSFLSIPCLEY